MTITVRMAQDEASGAQLSEHLEACDAEFVPPLSQRIDIRDYAQRLISRSTRFEAWDGPRLVGLVAAYLDGGADLSAFVTSVSVLPEWNRRGIASRLMGRCIEGARLGGLENVRLEVGRDNPAAIALYRRLGFRDSGETNRVVTMELSLMMKDDHDN